MILMPVEFLSNLAARWPPQNHMGSENKADYRELPSRVGGIAFTFELLFLWTGLQ